MAEENDTKNSEPEQREYSQERSEALGGSTQKGYTSEGDDGSEGGYGFISPSAESNDSSESE